MPIHFGVTECKKVEIPPMGVSCFTLWCYIYCILWKKRETVKIRARYWKIHVLDSFSSNKSKQIIYQFHDSCDNLYCAPPVQEKGSQGATKVVILLSRTWAKDLWTSRLSHLLVRRTCGFQIFCEINYYRILPKCIQTSGSWKELSNFRTSGTDIFCHTLLLLPHQGLELSVISGRTMDTIALHIFVKTPGIGQ